MGNNYKLAAEEARQFFVRLLAECNALNAKITGYGERLVGITKQGNPTEFAAIMKESAADLELFGQRVDQLLPDYQRNIELLTEGFAERNKSLDPTTEAGAQELEDMRREAQKLAATASGAKPNIEGLRSILEVIHNSNYDPGLTQAVNRVISTTDTLFTAYDDLETLALNVSFSANRE